MYYLQPWFHWDCLPVRMILNVTYFSEQMVATDASAYHYKVTFKSQLILPDVDVRTSTKSQD